MRRRVAASRMTISDSSPASSRRHFRLHHCRRGIGGLPARQSSDNGPVHRCCCSKPAGATAISGFTFPSASPASPTIRASTGAMKRAGAASRQSPHPHARGKTLGRSSSINGMVYVRGHGSDYDQWRQMGNIGWGWDDVLPYFRKLEDHYGGASDTHGAGGHQGVDAGPALKFSMPIAMPPRRAAPLPYCQWRRRTPKARRCSNSPSARAFAGRRRRGFLNPAKNRPDLKITPRARKPRAFCSASEGRRHRLHRKRRARVALTRRSHPDGRRIRFAANLLQECRALAPARCCSRTASPWFTSCRASARICRTTG